MYQRESRFFVPHVHLLCPVLQRLVQYRPQLAHAPPAIYPPPLSIHVASSSSVIHPARHPRGHSCPIPCRPRLQYLSSPRHDCSASPNIDKKRPNSSLSSVFVRLPLAPFAATPFCAFPTITPTIPPDLCLLRARRRQHQGSTTNNTASCRNGSYPTTVSLFFLATSIHTIPTIHTNHPYQPSVPTIRTNHPSVHPPLDPSTPFFLSHIHHSPKQ
ncbi:MAG: hypothetical protein J3Q66DRAFT_134351 [Benniella sp.]|nr:MAG: hypothetical protein J3Q66DRAFT_134351 [Benniella sp.]